LKLGFTLEDHSGRERPHALNLFRLGAFPSLGHVVSEDVVLEEGDLLGRQVLQAVEEVTVCDDSVLLPE
jgi:hypothetical protein